MKCTNFLKLLGEKIPTNHFFCMQFILLIVGVLILAPNSINCTYFKVYTLSMPSGYRILALLVVPTAELCISKELEWLFYSFYI